MRSLHAEPVAVTVLTGFLGAGKTTLLNRLLKDPALESTAVVINEFGEVSIDHLLVEQASDGVVELSDGCLCCTVRGELVDTLADLADRMQTGRIAPLKRVVIETTGLADPVPVLHSIMGHPALVQAYRLDGVVCLVDAVNGAATLDAHAEAVRQVAVADRLVVTKADLADPADVAALRVRLGRLNPRALMMPVEDAIEAPTRLVDCGLYDSATRSAALAAWMGEAHAGHDQAAHAHGDHDHGDHDHAGHDHHHHAHDHRVGSLALVHPDAVAYSSVEMFLDLLRSTQGERLLRIKGVIEIADDPSRPVVIHGVQKLLHPPARLREWPQGPRGVRLVVIGFDLPTAYVRELFDAFMGKPAPDRPDRAALTDNPLAIAGYRA